MKKSHISIFIILTIISLTNYVLSDTFTEIKVGIVDIKTAINSSAEVKKLKSERQQQINLLNKFIEDKKTSLENETNIKKRKDLEEKYNEELAIKKSSAQKTYEAKIIAIQNKFYKLIDKEAKTKNYDIVLSNSAVLYGGEDITNDITSKIK